jgi:hypothetical protein
MTAAATAGAVSDAATPGVTASWRILNTLDDEPRHTPVQVSALLAAQDVPAEVLVRLHRNGLVWGTFSGQRTRMDLADHLEHGRSLSVVQVQLSNKGHAVVAEPANQVLRNLAAANRRSVALRQLLAASGADLELVAGLFLDGRVVVTLTRDGEPVDSSMVHRLPAQSLRVRLTDKGRQRLPLRGE